MTDNLVDPSASPHSQSAEDVVAFLYHELRAAARRQLSHERPSHTLSSMALVHEVYLRIEKQRKFWNDEAHFVSVASRMMRQILVDHARARNRLKRGGGEAAVDLEEAQVVAPSDGTLDVEALDEALTELTRLNERQGRVVELRFFGGLGVEQTAAVLKLSPKTVKRDWAMARVWLRGRLENPKTDSTKIP